MNEVTSAVRVRVGPAPKASLGGALERRDRHPEEQIIEPWRSYRLACLQGRWSTAEFAMSRINTLLERMLADRPHLRGVFDEDY